MSEEPERHHEDLSYLTRSDLGMTRESIKRSFAGHVEYTQGKDEFSATPPDFFMAAALSARDRMLDRWNKTQQAFYRGDRKRVYYLSLEFLIGRLLEDGLINLGIHEETREALAELGLNLDEIAEAEWDAGLGNGGLGRLAACFLDSMASLGLPGIGYGIRYEYGMFKQNIEDGAQVEYPDNWLRYGSPWEQPRPERLYPVRFYGRVRQYTNGMGTLVHEWVDTEDVMAMAYDVPIPGYRNGKVNNLRLWAAKASREFNLDYFNRGDYIQALQDKTATENISRVLYPSDVVDVGKELRLKQEYFFVSATLQDAVRRHLKTHADLYDLPEKAVFQLNDTHPSVAVAELMRLLLDEWHMDWDAAWSVTTRCFAYTNHTVLPEALETWPVALFERVLPRHLQIIYEINRRFLAEVRARYPGDEARVQRLSLIAEWPVKAVRMAHLAVVGSFSVNGVSELHTRILRERIFRGFAELYPHRFNNKTNGITPRRWLLKCNPPLARCLDARVGPGWVSDLDRLRELERHADDPGFQAEWRAAKRANKERLAELIRLQCGVTVDPASLFDVQVKRLHEYKRQLLNVLHIIALYQAYRISPPAEPVPRTFIFGGKAAPGYAMAKRIIRLINAVAAVVNRDPKVDGLLKVAFLPNYGVSLAERIIPATDLSEQISTAGTEASGTGNMKLSLNGALTIGTLDGANLEIREAVGPENFFAFGLDYEQAQRLRERGYDPRGVYAGDPVLKRVIDSIARGGYSPQEPRLFASIVASLLEGGDPFLVLADFAAYAACQREVAALWNDPAEWTRRSILNVARMGRFSSDHTIARYAREIWDIPLPDDASSGPAASLERAG